MACCFDDCPGGFVGAVEYVMTSLQLVADPNFDYGSWGAAVGGPVARGYAAVGFFLYLP